MFSPKNQWLTRLLRDNQSFCALALVTYLVQQPRTTAPLRGDQRMGGATALGGVLRCLCVGFMGFAVGLLVGSLCVYTERCALCGCGVVLLDSLRSLRSTDWQLYFLNPLWPHATCGIGEAENSLVLEEYDGYALCG